MKVTSQICNYGGSKYVGSVTQYFLDGLLPCLHEVAEKYIAVEAAKQTGMFVRNTAAKDVIMSLRAMSGCYLIISDWQTALHCLWFKYDAADFGPELEERVRAENLASVSELARVNCPAEVVKQILKK